MTEETTRLFANQESYMLRRVTGLSTEEALKALHIDFFLYDSESSDFTGMDTWRDWNYASGLSWHEILTSKIYDQR